jgi:hypothetical protein
MPIWVAPVKYSASVTFVHQDQIKKVRREISIDVLKLLSAGNTLVQGEVDLIGFINLAVAYLGHDRAEGLKVIGHGLVYENVAVGEVEDALFLAGFPEPPDDLESRVGLPCASRHD